MLRPAARLPGFELFCCTGAPLRLGFGVHRVAAEGLGFRLEVSGSGGLGFGVSLGGSERKDFAEALHAGTDIAWVKTLKSCVR